MKTFRLECAGSLGTQDATDEAIRRAFEDDAGRGEFAILTAPDGSFMQVGEGAGPFVVEHRDGSTEEHIQTTAPLSKPEARDAFLQFLRGDASWRTSRAWKPLEEARRGCLSAVLLAVSLGLAACAGCQQAAAPDTVAEGVIFSVEWELKDGETGGFTRMNNRAGVPGGNGSWNIDAHGKLTRDYLIITRPGQSDLGPQVIPARRLVDVTFGTGGIETVEKDATGAIETQPKE